MTPFLWALGDSWTDPASSGGVGTGWAQIVADRLGVGIVNSAVGGAGYAVLTSSGSSFPVQAARGAGVGASLVVVFGSVNDPLLSRTPDEVRDGATVTYGLLRRLCPGAPLLVIGPQWGAAPIPAALLAARDAVRSAAAAAGADFVDPSGWLLGRTDLLLDANHPNRLGHVLLADRVEHDVALLLEVARPTLPA
jgi:lysophospholipase L1-like esterase